MTTPLIKQIHLQYLETKSFELPGELLPAARGFNLLNWARELYQYYRDEDIVVRAFDVLPPLRLAQRETISTTIQDVHKFIISDLNMIPLETRRTVFAEAIAHASAQAAWEQIAPLLLGYLSKMDPDIVQEELSWTHSPIAEVLWALSWFFIEHEEVVPPDDIQMISRRFPYYRWATATGAQEFWGPEVPLCRREWLAMDLLRRWLAKS